MKGWVYIITNKSMPELLKVGFSTKDPELRAEELHTTGVPHRFVVEYDALVNEPFEVEQKAHALLKGYHENKEWFRCDIATAIIAIRQAANGSIILESNKDDLTSETPQVAEYRKAAQQGDAIAQYNLGCAYVNGNGITKNEIQAVYWYRKAAEQGIASAQNNLGYSYGNGRGINKDDAQAVIWYRKAAEQGERYAQHNLGVMYENGTGVAKDETQAIAWYHKAAEQGHASAMAAEKRLIEKIALEKKLEEERQARIKRELEQKQEAERQARIKLEIQQKQEAERQAKRLELEKIDAETKKILEKNAIGGVSFSWALGIAILIATSNQKIDAVGVLWLPVTILVVDAWARESNKNAARELRKKYGLPPDI